MKKIFAAFFILIFLGPALAHQPRIVSEEETLIQNPEISQAFYGVLEGEEHHYEIDAEEPFTLFVSILVPDVPGIEKDVSVEVEFEGQQLFALDAGSQEWPRYFEEFAGDHYFQGPEKEVQAEAGSYDIHVFSPDNEGKYVLVVGKREEFPLGEMLSTVLTLPALKQDFFEKPAFTAYFNLIGLFVLLPALIIALVLAFLAFKLYKKFNKGKKYNWLKWTK
jgi:hypothetical protein